MSGPVNICFSPTKDSMVKGNAITSSHTLLITTALIGHREPLALFPGSRGMRAWEWGYQSLGIVCS